VTTDNARVHELRHRKDKTLAGLARRCFLHRRAVPAVWLIALIGFFATGRLTGSAATTTLLDRLRAAVPQAEAVVFRSLLIPLVASVMNLLSFGVALGVMTAAFQFGWGKPVLGFSQAGPITAWLPAMMFAILIGLSTDYEVFLISRMHEEWTLTRDNKRAVIRGQAETGRVITAASLIMILVFASFILGGQMSVMQGGDHAGTVEADDRTGAASG
jgi:hypothetical protein